MENNPRVAFLVPVYQSVDLLDDWAKCVRELDPRPDIIVFCENNSTDGTLEKLYTLDLDGIPTKILRFWTVDLKDKSKLPFKDCYNVIAHARQLLLTWARNNDIDFGFFVDADVFIQTKDTIYAFTLWNRDIVGGAYPRIFPEGVYIATLFYSSPRGEEVKRWAKLKKLDAGVLTYEVHATSGGCLCLSKKIIDDRRVNFYPVPENYSEDFGYCKTARDNGYKVYLEGTVLLGHKITVRWRSWDVVRQDDNERSKAFDDGSMIKRIKEEVAEAKNKKANEDNELTRLREERMNKYRMLRGRRVG